MINAEISEGIFDTQRDAPESAESLGNAQPRVSKKIKSKQGEVIKLIEFVNQGKSNSLSNENIQQQVEKFLQAKRKIKKIKPTPNLKVRKSELANKSQKAAPEMKPKALSAAKRTSEPSSAQEALSETDMLQTIDALKRTIDNLSKQLEEERAKNCSVSNQGGNVYSDKRRDEEPKEGRKDGLTNKRPRQNSTSSSILETAGSSSGLLRPASNTYGDNMDFEELEGQSQMQSSTRLDDVLHRTSSTKSASVKPPIINIMESSQQISLRLLKETLGLKNFTIKRLNSNKHYVQLENLSDYKTVIDTLTLRKIQFYTYTPKSLKTHSILLKGIDPSFSTVEILTELKGLKLPKVDVIGECPILLLPVPVEIIRLSLFS